MRKKIILGVVVLAIIVGATTLVVLKKNKIQSNHGQPQQSAEEILEERARQAGFHIKTPLGVSFKAKNWKEFDNQFQPAKDFNQLGEIIRACFIENCFKDFNKAEQDHVLSYVVKTFSVMKPQDVALAGILITQFERLPSPPHDSENYKTIAGWYLDPDASPVQKRMAVLKLGVQDADPAMQWVHVITQGLTGKTFGVTHSSWIQMVGDMRNINSRKVVLVAMLKDFGKIEKNAQPDALIILAQNSANLPKVKELFFKFLASNDQEEFEAALKSIVPMKDERAFNEHDTTKIKDRLHSFPDNLKTPYVELKVKELLGTLK